jgi:hypothetical protein
MISICAWETTLGHVMMDDVSSCYRPIGVVFHGPHGSGLNTQPPSQGEAASDCTHGTCNPVNFTVLKPSDWTQGRTIGIRIDGKGLDPGSLMHLKLVTVTHKSSSYQVFHSFYEEMRNEFSISAKAKILFLSLAESIDAQCHFMQCLWGRQHGRPLPTRAF